MNIKSTKLALAIILVLGMQVASVNAAGNSLNRLDVRKSQTDSSVEVLLYTADPYGDNVAVTKKSDNRYVILMPNLSGNGASRPDLSGISDIVSNVDVSSVNDSGHGYTKITLTTTKPVNIKTRLQKSMPVTPEQQAYRDLIAKSRAMTSAPSYIPDSQPQKKEETKPVETKQQSPVQPVVKQTQKDDTKKVVEDIKKVAEKVSDKKTEKKSVEKNVDNKKADTKKTESVVVVNKSTNTNTPVTNEVKPSSDNNVDVKQQVEQKPVDIQPENFVEPVPVQVAEADIDVVPAVPVTASHKSRGIPLSWFMIMLPLAGLFFLTKLISRVVVVSKTSSKNSFIDNIAEMPSESKLEVAYDSPSIMNESINNSDVMYDETMNWQEKYQHYVSTSDKDAEFVQKAVVAADSGSISIVNNSTQEVSDVVNEMKKPAKPLETPVSKGKVSELKSKSQSQALPVEIVEPIEIVEPPLPNPANRMKKAKKVEPKKVTPKKPVKPVQKVVNNDEVKKLQQRIEKLEAERVLKEEKIKELEVQAAKPKNDFEKLADKKMQEVKVMENKKNEEEYLVNLEELLHKSPSVEKTNIKEDIILHEITTNFTDVKVHKEDDMIANNMINSVSSIPVSKKFKAFENKIALEESYRKNPLPKSRLEQSYHKASEGRHVNLGYSSLTSPSRVLEGGNLRVGDLIAKSGKFLKNPVTKPAAMPVVEPKVQPEKSISSSKDYSMATIEEFFAMDEIKKPAALPSSSLSDKVAQSLAQVKPSMNIKKAVPAKENITNPISQLKSETKDKYINGLIVKSGFNIDKNRGFYIVNLDGETALIGRVKEEIFVLKKFDRALERPLQVRQDNGNVYMVKADGFRSLVEVSEDKMGVLIEL